MTKTKPAAGGAATSRTIAVLALAACVAFGAGRAAAADVVDVDSRGGHVRLLVDRPAGAPAGVAVLFAGGPGVLEISAFGGIGKLGGNFLVRSRSAFNDHGWITAVIDAPSDHGDSLLYGFRGSAEHAADVAAVIARLRSEFGLPVWLVGTSRGTESVANAAVRLAGGGGPDGIVLTATMLGRNRGGPHVLSMDLDRVQVPVVIAHHRDDECKYTLPGNVDYLASEFTGARSVKVLWYEGGSARGNACQAFHHHGFNGIEANVVADIAKAMADAGSEG